MDIGHEQSQKQPLLPLRPVNLQDTIPFFLSCSKKRRKPVIPASFLFLSLSEEALIRFRRP